MICAIPIAPAIDGLKKLVSCGQERAGALNRPIVVSLARQICSDLSPLAFFAAKTKTIYHSNENRGPSASLIADQVRTGTDAGNRHAPFRTFWGQPEQDFWIAGQGKAAVLTFDGDGCIAKVMNEHRKLMETAVIDAPGVRGVGPLFLGGFRYDSRIFRDAVWQGFPDALMVLPQFLFTRSKGITWLTINTLVNPETDPLTRAEALIAELRNLDASTPGESPQPTIKRLSQTSLEEWRKRVNDTLRAIESGLLTKVILARRKELHSEAPFSVGTALKRLYQSYTECTIFAFENEGASFVGATPETLARVEEGRLSLTCLASSSPRGSSPEMDSILEKQLLASCKERREHEVVVTMLVNTLKDISRELHWNNTPQVWKLKNVQHLLTPFVAELNEGCGILDIVKRLHPTPAVGGTPTDRALEFIGNMEGDRGWYAAPVGWIDQKTGGEFVVALRSALLRENKAFLYAGAGIVRGSDPDQEFEETEIKFQPMLAALGSN